MNEGLGTDQLLTNYITCSASECCWIFTPIEHCSQIEIGESKGRSNVRNGGRVKEMKVELSEELGTDQLTN